MHLAQRALAEPIHKKDRRLHDEAYLLMHEIYARQGEIAKADSLASLLVHAKRPNPLLYMRLGNSYRRKNSDMALALFRTGVTVSTADNVLGSVAFGTFTRERLEELARSIRNDFELEIAEILLDQKEYAETIATLEPLLGGNERIQGRITYKLGQAYAGAGRFDEAIEVLCESVIVHKMDEAKTELVDAYRERHGSTHGLQELLLQTAARQLQQERAGEARTEVPTTKKMSIEEAIVQARTILSKKAPAFTVKTFDGTISSREIMKNKVVILNFWATWCGPCREELPHLQKAYEYYQNANDVLFLAISIDDAVDLVERFIEKNKYTFPVAHQPELGKRFGVTAIPTTVILTGDGTIHYRWTGFRPGTDLVQELREKIEPLRQFAVKN